MLELTTHERRRPFLQPMTRRWFCDICGGNYETGCLYFDPTECPR